MHFLYLGNRSRYTITNSVESERILQNAIFLHNLSICFRRSKMLNSLNIYIYCNFFYLLLAATVAEYGSKIYVFSDAVPRNDVTIRYIQAMQSEKDLTISLLLTGQCKQKRSIGKYLSKEAVRIIHIVNKDKFTYEKTPN